MKISAGWYPFVGLLIAAVGVVAPIGWDLYKSRASVEVQLLSTVRLVDPTEKLEKLEIRYSGEIIPDISRVTIAIANTGRIPIQEKDFISPIVISFPEKVRLLDVKIDRRSATDLDVNYSVDLKAREVKTRFPLLNPNDYVQFGVLLTGQPLGIATRGRIVGVSGQLPFLDFSNKRKPEGKSVNLWTVIPVGFFSALLAIAAVGFLPWALSEYRLRIKIQKGDYQLPNLPDKDAYLSYVDAALPFLAGTEEKSAKRMVSRLTYPLSDADKKTLQDHLAELIKHTPSSAMIGGISFVLAVLGIWYVIMSFFF